jgi:ankyrin repeat protein
MKLLSALFAILALSFSIHAHALTDDDSLTFVSALGDGDIKVVKKFVEADASNANYKSFAWSSVQMAANKGQLEVVKYLIGKGADLNYIHPLSHNTAFHLAVFNGYKDVATLLAKSGANINEKLKANVSLLRPFQDANNEEMVKFLTDLGVKDDGCKELKCFDEPN